MEEIVVTASRVTPAAPRQPATPSQQYQACESRPPFMEDSDVNSELDDAWSDSNPFADDVPRGQPGSKKVEQGGWIVEIDLYIASYYYTVRVPSGSRDSLPSMVGSRPNPIWGDVVGWYHTHPNTRGEKYSPRPSPEDIEFTNKYAKVPAVVVSHEGYYFVCPVR